MKFSEFTINDTFTTKKVVLTEEEIIQYANQFDPQYFHTDKQVAEKSPYGSLIASGFHTIGVVWAEWIRMDILGRECLGGINAQLEWSQPVKPNDEIYGKMTVLDKKRSSDGKRGLVTFQLEIFNQEEVCVSKCQMKVFVAD